MKVSGLLHIASMLFLCCHAPGGHAQNDFNQKSANLRSIDPEQSLYFARWALWESCRENDTAETALSYKNMGVAFYFSGEFDSASVYLQKSLEWYTAANDSTGISAALLNLGNVCRQTTSLKEAEQYFLGSLTIDLKLNDLAGIALGLNNLAQIHHFRGKYNSASELYRMSARFHILTQNTFGAAQAWMNTAVLLIETGNTGSASVYLNAAFTVFEKVNDPFHTALCLMNMGDLNRLSGNDSVARLQLWKAIELCRENDFHSEAATAWLYYSYLLSDLHQKDSAEICFFKSMELCLETDNDFLAQHALIQRAKDLASEENYRESNACLINAESFAMRMDYLANLKVIYLQLSNNYTMLGDFNKAWTYRLKADSLLKDEVKAESHSISEKQIINDFPSSRSILLGICIGLFISGSLLLLYRRKMTTNN